MAGTIKKIGNYGLIITVIGAITAAPAKAVNLIGSTTEELNIDQINKLEPLQEELLKEAQTSVNAAIKASEITEETVNGKKIYNYQPRNTSDIAIQTQPYTTIYSNVWKAPELPPPRKVPEPSALLGLITIAGLFFTQRQKKS